MLFSSDILKAELVIYIVIAFQLSQTVSVCLDFQTSIRR